MAKVTVDDVEGVNKDHVRRKNGGEWSCISSIVYRLYYSSNSTMPHMNRTFRDIEDVKMASVICIIKLGAAMIWVVNLFPRIVAASF